MSEPTADEYIGPYTKEQNISIGDILRPASKSVHKFSNGFIYEIRKIQNQIKLPLKLLWSLQKENVNMKRQILTVYEKKIQQTYSKIKLLRKKGNAKALENFCRSQFEPPVTNTSNLDPKEKELVKTIKETVKCVKTENLQLKRGLEQSQNEIDQLDSQIDKLENYRNLSIQLLSNIQIQHRNSIAKFSNDKQNLEKETSKWQKKYQQISESLDKSNKELDEAKTKLSRYNVRNVNKRQKRLNEKYLTTLSDKQELEVKVQENGEQMQDLQKTIDQKQQEIDNVVSSLDLSETKINELKSEKHKLQKRLCGLKISSTKTKCNLIEKHDYEIEELRKQVNMHNKKITELEQLNIILENDQINTFENGRYTNEVRECIMSLVTECNVSLNKVNNVISVVLRKLTGVLPQRLPSMAVKSRLLVEAKAVAQQQIVDAMLTDVDPSSLVGNTLHSDATSKFFKHYQSFQVTLPNGSAMSIGLSEVGVVMLGQFYKVLSL